MSRLSRITQVIFGSSGLVGTGGFGAAAAGNTATNTATSSALSTLMGTTQWASGWLSATLGGSKFPAVEDNNAFAYVTTAQLAYLFSQGIPEYDSGTTYFVNQICMKAGTFQIYGSLTDNNTGNALTSGANWQLLADFSGGMRTRLTANTTYYVTSTGNDSTGNGTSGSPWLTIQKAVNYVNTYIDCNGYAVTINVGAGTYAPFASNQPLVGTSSYLLISGDTTTPSNVTISSTSTTCISVASAAISIQGLKITNSGGDGISAANSGGVIGIVGNMEFGTCAGAHMDAVRGDIEINSNYKITGGASYHMLSQLGGLIRYSSAATVTLTGTPAFSSAFAAALLSNIYAPSITYSGSATGTRYTVSLNGVINTGGGGANYFPGNVAGSSPTGGQYA